MRIFERSTAWVLVLCLILSLALSMGPVAPEAHAAQYDPYAFTLGPGSGVVPSYYDPYARPFVGWSAHEVGYFEIVRMFNLTNVSEILPTKPENFTPGYASFPAFCCDHGTPYRFGSRYRMLNFEDAYFSDSGDYERAKHVRAIIRHSLPYYKDASVVQKAANEYFGSQVVKNLTSGEMAAAAQAAVWTYTNDIDYGPEPYFCTVDFEDYGNDLAYGDEIRKSISTSSPLNVYENQTAYTENNINKVYQYLLALSGEEATDIIIKQDALSLKKVYFDGKTLTLYVKINGTVDSNDELVLTAKCGSKTQTLAVGGKGTLGNAQGLFPITLTGVSQADCANVQLELTGKQTVMDAVFFQAEPKGNYDARLASQGFGGYCAIGAPVYAETAVHALKDAEELVITKVDAQSGKPLSGVAFDLYMKQGGNDLKMGSFVTDTNGQIKVMVTDASEYYFVETGALNGYQAITGSVGGGKVSNSWNAGRLQITKQLINTTPGKPNTTFSFKLTLDLSTAPLMNNGISWMTADHIKNQLQSSKSLNWSVSGNKLTGTFTLNAGQTVDINSIPLGASYTVEEVMSAQDQAWFNVTSQVDGNAAKNSNIATGTVNTTNAVTFSNSVVTADVKTGKLEISKVLVNKSPATVDKTFRFKITLDLSTADAYKNSTPWMTDDYLMDNITGDLSWIKINGKYTANFSVEAGKTQVIDGIPQGATYTVEEVLSAEDREWFDVTSKVNSNAAQSSNTASGAVAAQNAVVFTNTVKTVQVQTANLNISKQLINNSPAQVGKTFRFKVTIDLSKADAYSSNLPWMNDEYLLGKIVCAEDLKWTGKNGKYTTNLTVNAGKSVAIMGLAYGTVYTVEELLGADENQFTVTTKVGNENAKNGTTANGTIGAVNAVLVTNTVVTTEVETADLNISKHLINSTPAEVSKTFSFKITVDLSTADAYKNPVFWMNDQYLLDMISGIELTEENGKYVATFTVEAEDTFVIKNLPKGVTYTVEEVLSAEDLQWFSVTTQVGNNEAQTSDTANGTVGNVNAVLFTNTVVTGDEVRLGDLSVNKQLINTTPAQVGETFNFKVTIDLSTADAYKNAAPWLNDEYLLSKISGKGLSWTKENDKYTATFTVNAGDTFVIHGLAYGVDYTVEEIVTSADLEKFTVTSQVGSEEAKNSATAAGSIAQRNAVIFTNSVKTTEVSTGSLDVSKQLVNTTPAQVGETFNFKITVDFSTADAYKNPVFWMNDQYLLSQISSAENLQWTEENGKHIATFTVDAAETVTINGIAQGATYTVEEILTSADLEKFTVTTQIGSEAAKEGTSVSSAVAEKNAVIFTNSVKTTTVETSDLNISKHLINTTPAEVSKTFRFKITVDLSTADAYKNPVFWMNDQYLLDMISGIELTENNGKYTATFTLDAEDTFVIKNLPKGAIYTLEEVLTSGDAAKFAVTTQVGNASAQNGSTAIGTIGNVNAVLYTNTVTDTQVTTGSLDVSKQLVNTTPAHVGETFNFKITVDFSTADAYKNPVFWMNDQYLLGKISSSENLQWTEENGKYAAAFTVDAAETVTINGIARGATYTVEELLTSSDLEKFTVTTQIGSEAAKEGTSVSSAVAEKNAVIFTNSVKTTTVETSDLNISKHLINTTPAEVSKTFRFKITVDLSTADAYKNPVFWMNDQYLLDMISGIELTEENGKYVATFTVEAEDTFVIKNLPKGVTYTVEEVLSAEDLQWFSVTTQVGNNEAQTSDTANGTVGNVNAVLFTNTVVTGDEVRLGDLSVNKQLINTTPAQVGETFNFKVTIDLSTADAYKNAAPWLNDEYLLSKISGKGLSWTKENDKYTATFTVNAGDTFVIHGLAYGVDYTVEEIVTSADLEKFTVTSQVGSEEAKNSATAAGSIAQRNAVIFTNSVKTTEVSTGSLDVSKQLVNTTPAQVGETFNFKITVDFSTADAYKNPVFWMNDQYLLGKISSSENLQWTEENGKYAAAFTVDAAETVTINGIARGATYTVEELLTSSDLEKFTVTTQIGSEAAKEGTSVSSAVAEKNAVIFTNSVKTTTVETADLNISKHLINTTPAEVSKTFSFKITVDLSTADAYKNPVFWMNDQYLLSKISSAENLQWTEENGKYAATFTVDAAETVTINGIALGATYTVEEVLSEDDEAWFNVTSRIGDGKTLDSHKAEGTVGEQNDILFTNSVVTGELKGGRLDVTKKLVNNTPAQVEGPFTFRIIVDFSSADIYTDGIPWITDEYLLNFINSTQVLAWEETDGLFSAIFTVDADETFSFSGLACGAQYTIVEVLSAEEQNWFESIAQVGGSYMSNGTARSIIGEQNDVIFTNYVVTGPELVTGSVDVSKQLVNTTPAQVGETFNFQITLDLSTADVYTDAAFWMNDEYLMSFITGTEDLTWTEENGKHIATFTVKAGETVTIDGIARGATYTVEEILTQEDREWFTVTSQIGEQEATASDSATGTVAEKNALIFTNTVVTGPELVTGRVDVNKKLVNNTPAKVGETFNFQITLDLSTADVYTNAAPWMNDEYLMSFITGTEDLTWTEENGKHIATFTVNVDETVTIDGIAQGATYTVEEILTQEDREWFTVTSQIGEQEATASNSATGTVAEKNALTFTNTVVTGIALGTGKLGIGKELVNAHDAKGHEKYTFRVTLNLAEAEIYQDPAPWMNDEYLLEKIAGDLNLTWTKIGEKLYTATFALKSGEEISIDGIAIGAGFTVEEVLSAAERNNYRVTTSISTNGGTAQENVSTVVRGNIAADNDVIFYNQYLAPIPVTDDISLTAPIVMMLMAMMMTAVLTLNKRRFMGE